MLTNYCNSFFGLVSQKRRFGSSVLKKPEVGVWRMSIIGYKLQDKHGQKSLEDASRFYPASGNKAWHGANAEIQPTWRHDRMLLLAQGQADTQNMILDYQRSQLGCEDGETCLMELFPLPSPNIEVWNYNQWTTLTWLQSRNSYIREIRTRRENESRRLISEHRPKVVIRSMALTVHFFRVGRQSRVDVLNRQRRGDLLWRANANTVFLATRHPVAESDEYFRKIRRFLRTNHANRFQNN